MTALHEPDFARRHWYGEQMLPRPGEISPQKCLDCNEHHKVVRDADDSTLIGWVCHGNAHVFMRLLVGHRPSMDNP